MEHVQHPENSLGPLLVNPTLWKGWIERSFLDNTPEIRAAGDFSLAMKGLKFICGFALVSTELKAQCKVMI